MSLVALHNGGGVGIGKSVNGGFVVLMAASEWTRLLNQLSCGMSWEV